MYIAGTELCQIYVEEPPVLITALYLRDVAGLNPHLDYELPELDPPVTVWPVWARRAPVGWEPPITVPTALVSVEDAATEWVRWWHHLLRAGPSLTEEFRPPAFRDFRTVPAIRLLLQRHYEEAARWVDAVTDDPRVHRDLVAPRPGLFGLVKEIETDNPRPVHPFRLRLTVIPVRAKRAWPLAPDHVLISRRLIADIDNVLDWLRPRVFALAAGRAPTTIGH